MILLAEPGSSFGESDKRSEEVKGSKLDRDIKDFLGSAKHILLIESADVSCMGKLVSHVFRIVRHAQPHDRVTVLAPFARIANAYPSNTEAISIYGALYKPEAQYYPDKEVIVSHLHENRDAAGHVYIIGDCHLISDSYREQDRRRFGSGRLLPDFMEYVGLPKSKRRIIFVGDPWQLSFASLQDTALSISRLREYSDTATKTRAKGFDSGTTAPIVLQNRRFLANRIRTRRSNLLELELDEDRCLRFPIAAGRIRQFARRLADDNLAGTKVIAHTNTRVNRYTQFIRRQVLGRGADLDVGDLVVARNTFHVSGSDWLITSGTFGEVCAVLGEKRIKQRLRGRSKPVLVDFLNLRVRWHNDSNDHAAEVCCFKSYLYAEKPGLPSDVTIALIAHARKNGKGLRGPGEDLSHDRYLNAAKLRFGYAMTLHYAQGMHFDNLVADLAPGKGLGSGERYLRWLYTLFTVPRCKTYLINIPRIHPLAQAQWTLDSSQRGPVRLSNPIAFDPTAPASGRSAEFDIASEELRNLYRFIRDRLAEIDCKVTAVKHYQYQEGYTVASELGGTCALRVYYNKKYRVTRVVTVTFQPGEFAEQISRALAPEPVFEDDRQEELYQETTRVLEGKHLKITAVEHHQYQEVYILDGRIGKAKLAVHYDKDGTVTQGRLLEHSSDAVLRELKELLAS